MPRAEVGTAKYLANKMKSKGLQRLRWYCQVCEKQCRDENGFKCHMATESHLRQMLVVGESAGKHISDFSSQFQAEFVALLSRRFGTKRVLANRVYQEYIQDKSHLHMNATRWVTLTEFAKHLGRTGVARVDETEKGWFIAWIDNSPNALAKAEANAKKERLQVSDEQRERELLKAQIEKAQAEAEAIGLSTPGASTSAAAEAGLKREEGQKLVLSLGKKPASPPAESESPSSVDGSGSNLPATTSASSEPGPSSSSSATLAPTPAPAQQPLKLNVFKPAGNPLKKNVFKMASKPAAQSRASAPGAVAGAKRDLSTLSAGERLMAEEMERKKLRM
ncbi:hypothetical protein M407DRAFT_241048 [Tulasnella calospora MUT 4182]|uniref:DNA/RNA-binding protein Kin17 WH-like domain-containing protein n=1 Tax=Tulasnella calospora MUT 4182 TaxID=1051891 RepID=A0A0C3MIE5_9AGAM|nr:hypothetical protein M407DRAFT_241048 [Tulasnella calospora MUT 4182]